MQVISDIGEKEAIASLITPLLKTPGKGIGIGDDAAVIPLTDSLAVVLTIDRIPHQLVAYVKGVMTDYDVGRYLIVANLSDLAAMGAHPVGVLVSLCLPLDYRIHDLREFVRGVADAAKEYGAPVIGGDTKSGPSANFVAAAVGTIEYSKAMRRSGARPGDAIMVTGTPGAFGAGLAYLLIAKEAGLKLPKQDEHELLQKLTHPVPRLEEGSFLAQSGFANACQDISDGIGQTLVEIAAMSSVGCEIHSSLLAKACPKAAIQISSFCECGIEDILLGPGADFELLTAVPPRKVPKIQEAFSARGWPLHKIGQFCDTGMVLVRESGDREPLRGMGWEHFAGESDVDSIRSSYERGGERSSK
jgi:thiamine-monophosphate kinase